MVREVPKEAQIFEDKTEVLSLFGNRVPGDPEGVCNVEDRC